jgi:ABC-type sugar transport system substrate-binding protein
MTRERGVKQAEDAWSPIQISRRSTAANDDVALGAAQAVEAAGRGGQDDRDRHERRAAGAARVKDGKIAMTVELNPFLWGRLGVDVLASYLKGDKGRAAGLHQTRHRRQDQHRPKTPEVVGTWQSSLRRSGCA